MPFVRLARAAGVGLALAVAGVAQLDPLPRDVLLVAPSRDAVVGRAIDAPIAWLGGRLRRLEVPAASAAIDWRGVAGVITWFRRGDPVPSRLWTDVLATMPSRVRWVHLGSLRALGRGIGERTLRQWLAARGLQWHPRAHVPAVDIDLRTDAGFGFESSPRRRLAHVGPAHVGPSNRVWVETVRRGNRMDRAAGVVVGAWGGLALDPWFLAGTPSDKLGFAIDPFRFFAEALGLENPVPDPRVVCGRRVGLFGLHVDDPSLRAADGGPAASSGGDSTGRDSTGRDSAGRESAGRESAGRESAERTGGELALRELLARPLPWTAYLPAMERPVGLSAWCAAAQRTAGSRLEFAVEFQDAIGAASLVTELPHGAADPERALPAAVLAAFPAGSEPRGLMDDAFRAAVGLSADAGALVVGGCRLDALHPSIATVAAPWRTFDSGAADLAVVANTVIARERAFDHPLLPAGFVQVLETVRRTGAPRVLAPLAIHVDLRSMRDPARRRAIAEVLSAVDAMSCAPVATSEYGAAVRSAVRARVYPLPEAAGWAFRGFDACRTVRLPRGVPHGGIEAIDWRRSPGVVGAKRLGADVYLHLGASTAELRFTAALASASPTSASPASASSASASPLPILREANHAIRGAIRTASGLRLESSASFPRSLVFGGLGSGAAVDVRIESLQPQDRTEASVRERRSADADGRLLLELPAGTARIEITVVDSDGESRDDQDASAGDGSGGRR